MILKLQFKYSMLYAFLFSAFLTFGQGTLEVRGNGSTISSGSSTTSISNFTNFGNAEVGTNKSNIFVLDNTAGGGSPNRRLNNIEVSISGSSDFSPSSNNYGSLKGNQNPINHVITFSPSSTGTKTATVTITFTNGTNSPYTFSIEGTATLPLPEIEVSDSNNSSINVGGSFDFGAIEPNSSNTEVFSIENSGIESTVLNLTGSPTVSLTGDSEFTVSTQPASNNISGGSSTSFIISYNPTAIGSHNANLSIANNDTDENPYTFSLNGSAADITYNPITSGPDWTVTNLTPDFTLNNPNTILYGPDNYLWITERVGEQVVKVDPNLGGSKTVMLDLNSQVYRTGGQDGLMGMAIHPDLYTDVTTTTNNYVYLAYTYSTNGSDSGRKLRIARYNYNYNGGNGLLDSGSAVTILEDMDASNDHNSGKLIFGPDMKLYYTIGDQGANQFSNACNEIRAQYLPTSGGQTTFTGDKSDYKGKILRMNLDGSIPSDNPTLGGFQTHIYSYGHRNPQGIVFAADGKLYSSEHGPKVDDELNLIVAGQNYGWPGIAGYDDDGAYVYCNWSTSTSCGSFSDNGCPGDAESFAESDSNNDIIRQNLQVPIGTYNSTSAIDPQGGFLEWPTVAPAGIDIYEAGAIPNWGKSLLIPTLKRGTLFRTKLDATGNSLEDDTFYEEFHSSNDRYRDLTLDPDGITIYIITDSSGSTSGPSGTNPQSLENPGVIIKLQYKCLIGGVCDDGDPNTSNDVYDANCNCIGTVEPDSDNDGVFDSVDQCPDTPNGETVDSNGCSDSQLDDDEDGVTNNLDICPGYDDNLDADSDTVPDGCDICPGFDDNIDLDNDGVPDGCDALIDSDGDGVADSEDECPGFDDTVDVDNDNIPDGCDPLIDSDNDGVADSMDQCPGFDDTIDVDNDGIPDDCDSLIDSDGDGVADSVDQCPGFDDTIDVDNDGIPDDCDSLIDSDGDGVADSVDQCPGFDDNLDTNNNGIPDDCEITCVDSTTSFGNNPLTSSGGGSTSTTITFTAVSEDVSFDISNIGQRTGGKPSNRYIEQVVVEYDNGNGYQEFGTYTGNNVTGASIFIAGIVNSVRVSLSDIYQEGTTNTVMSVDFTIVDYCLNSSGAKSASVKNSTTYNSINSSANIKIYPNPTKSEFYVEQVEVDINSKLNIYNVIGQLVNSTKLRFNKQKVDVSNLPNGLYFVRILDNNENVISIKRIVKE